MTCQHAAGNNNVKGSKNRTKPNKKDKKDDNESETGNQFLDATLEHH